MWSSGAVWRSGRSLRAEPLHITFQPRRGHLRDICLLEVLLDSPQTNHSPTAPGKTSESILGHYLDFLKTTQGLADATLVLRRLHVQPFLRSLEVAVFSAT